MIRHALAALVLSTAFAGCTDPSAPPPPPERGTRIVFTIRMPCSDGSGTCDVPFSVDPDTSLLPARVDDVDPEVQQRFAWTLDGERVAFLQGDALRVATAGAGDAQTIVPSGVAPYQAIRWSPDGARLSYARGEELCAVTATGASLRCFGTGASRYWSFGFTADGGSLVALQHTIVETSGVFQVLKLGVFRLSLATGGRTRVDVYPGMSSSGATSPASSAMAFQSAEVAQLPGGTSTLSRLFVISLSGGDPRRLTRAQDLYHEWKPVFSPDGRRVAFAGIAGSWYPSESGEIAASDLYVVNLDGTGLLRLTTSGGAVPVSWVR